MRVIKRSVVSALRVLGKKGECPENERMNSWDELHWKRQEARILACTLAATYSDILDGQKK